MPLKGTRTVIHRGEAGYPSQLEEIADPPETLYMIGSVEALEPGLAVIGARKATPYGLSCARHFATLAKKTDSFSDIHKTSYKNEQDAAASRSLSKIIQLITNSRSA